jgi:hypothetical protein
MFAGSGAAAGDNLDFDLAQQFVASSRLSAVPRLPQPASDPLLAEGAAAFAPSRPAANFGIHAPIGSRQGIGSDGMDGFAMLSPVAGSGLVEGQQRSAAASNAVSTAARDQALASYNQVPLSFEANVGQADAAVHFLAHGSGYSLTLTAQEAVLNLQQPTTTSAVGARKPSEAAAMSLHVQLLGANAAPRLVGQDELPGKVNYYLSNNPIQWHAAVPTFGRVEYQGVYPGIDMVYYGHQGQLEYDFIAAPGADPRAISLHFAGVDGLSLDAGGDLVLHTASGDLRQQRPVLYQEVGGVRQEVAGSFALGDQDQVRFNLGAYDPSRPLIIDPVIVYASFFGPLLATDPMGNVGGQGIAVDSSGSAYVTGYTAALFTPPTSPLPTIYGPTGGLDAFITRIAPGGGAVLWTTYLGGSNDDISYGVALAPANFVDIAGYTQSPDFPVTAGVFQPVFGAGPTDGFVTSLLTVNGTLFQSTFLNFSFGGGPGNTTAYGVAVDSNFDVYATGYSDQGSPNAQVFAIALNPVLSAPLYLSIFGGPGTSFGSVGYGIAVDANNEAYLTGYTDSPAYPFTPFVYQPFFIPPYDAFVTKLDPAGAIIWSTFYTPSFGAPGGTEGNGIALGFGLANFTGSFVDSSNTVHAFVTALNFPGTALVGEVPLAGSVGEAGQAIAVDGAGNDYVTGWTFSPDFPVLSPLACCGSLTGTNNAFVTKLAPMAGPIIYSTYLGGSFSDAGYGIAADNGGDAYVTGNTMSRDFPTTAASFEPAPGPNLINYTDAFVTEIQ